MNIDFNSKPTYGDDDKYIKTKIKTYEDSVTTNLYNEKESKKIPEEKVPCKCLSIIIIDSVLYAYEKYHPKHFQKNANINNKKKLRKQQQHQQKNYIDEELKSEPDTDTDADNEE